MVRAHISTVLTMVFMAVAMQAQAATERVALVIGNSEYTAVSRLNNPSNDARDIAAAFENIGFEVEIQLDMDNSQLSDAFRDFHRKASKAKIAVVYYAGHGIEIENRNYLIPVDARLERTTDVFFEAVPMEKALLAVEGASELSLVILDACRDNPFAKTMRQSGGTRSVGRGLALVEPAGNSLVAYAAKGGTTAMDGEGENSPYAAALIEALQEPDVELSLLFRKVRDSVLEATDGVQEPFVYGSLSAKELFLNPGEGARPANAPTPAKEGGAVVAHLNQQFDPAFVTWGAIQSLDRGPNQERALRAFVDEFGTSPYAGAARVMLRSYGVEAPAPMPERKAGPEAEGVAKVEDASPTGTDVDLSRTERRLIQRGLAAAGLAVGGADGIFGPRTRAAIVSWQDKNDFRVTSYLSQSQAEKLMALGRAAPEPAPKPSVTAGAVAPAVPTKPSVNTGANTQVAAVEAPKAATGAPSGTLFLDMTLSFREDGREVVKNFVRGVPVSNGKGRYQAKFSDIGKFGPFIIDASLTRSNFSYNGQIVGRSFAGSSALINGNMTKTITISKGGIRYKLLIRGRFNP